MTRIPERLRQSWGRWCRCHLREMTTTRRGRNSSTTTCPSPSLPAAATPAEWATDHPRPPWSAPTAAAALPSLCQPLMPGTRSVRGKKMARERANFPVGWPVCIKLGAWCSDRVHVCNSPCLACPDQRTSILVDCAAAGDQMVAALTGTAAGVAAQGRAPAQRQPPGNPPAALRNAASGEPGPAVAPERSSPPGGLQPQRYRSGEPPTSCMCCTGNEGRSPWGRYQMEVAPSRVAVHHCAGGAIDEAA